MMGRLISLTLILAAVAALAEVPAQALPGIQPSIPGLESSITKRINNGVRRGLLTPMEANQLANRLQRLESREQMLINTGRLNSFERARIASELESINASLRFDTAGNRMRHPLRGW